MKKIKLFIITLILFLPSIIHAVEIKEITIVGKENIITKETFTESILISFNNLNRNYQQELGLMYIKYELIFNDKLLVISSIETPDWDSYVYKENDKYYVLSIVNNDNRLQQTCPNSFLSCGDYRATLEFFLNETTESTLSIDINNPEIALIDMSTYQEEYSYEDIMVKNSEKNTSYSLTISQNQSSSQVPSSKNIVLELTSDEIKEKIITALTQEPVLANISSNLLKEIKISNYEIDFNKHRNNYTINIPENITSLDFTIIPEDETANYKIVGNENLQNNDEIIIEVTSADNEINTYTIKIIKELTPDNQEFTTNFQKQTLKDLYNKYETIFNYAIIFILAIFLLIIIIKIISKIKDQKIEDLTNKF